MFYSREDVSLNKDNLNMMLGTLYQAAINVGQKIPTRNTVSGDNVKASKKQLTTIATTKSPSKFEKLLVYLVDAKHDVFQYLFAFSWF